MEEVIADIDGNVINLDENEEFQTMGEGVEDGNI